MLSQTVSLESSQVKSNLVFRRRQELPRGHLDDVDVVWIAACTGAGRTPLTVVTTYIHLVGGSTFELHATRVVLSEWVHVQVRVGNLHVLSINHLWMCPRWHNQSIVQVVRCEGVVVSLPWFAVGVEVRQRRHVQVHRPWVGRSGRVGQVEVRPHPRLVGAGRLRGSGWSNQSVVSKVIGQRCRHRWWCYGLGGRALAADVLFEEG